jgi:hypothetical protein
MESSGIEISDSSSRHSSKLPSSTTHPFFICTASSSINSKERSLQMEI